VGWVLLFVLVAVVAGVPLWLRSRLRMPDPKGAPGRFAELSQGVTHYRWIGPVRGPVAVAVHGLTTPSPVWEEVAAGLGDTGYRVLVYDLYGRGFSDTAAGRQDIAFHLRQLEDLLEHEGLGDDLTVLGYSMGGSIAAAFAAAHPDRVRRVILVAPAGIEVVQGRFEAWTAKLPLLGDWLQAVAGAARMTAAIAADAGAGALREVQLAQLRRPGFLAAVLSSRRGALAARMEAEHRTVGAAGVPVIAIWGEKDTVVPLRALGTLSAWNRKAAQEVVAGAGHGLPHSHAAEVVEILRGVLREVV
jgi:pimeloyl-ACP methyl ester carboxylesterase